MLTLLLVDIQNDFLPGGTLPIENGEQIIPVVNAIQRKFDLILATKDWHPKNHISFAKRHKKKPGEIIQVGEIAQELWPEHCVQNTKGAEFPAALETSNIEKVFLKGTDTEIDSYSAFFDNCRIHSTGLDAYLRKKGIQEIYVAGLATDYCVKFSAIDAIDLGFKVYMIEDACRGIDLYPGDVQKALAEIKKAGAKIILSREL